MTRHVVLPALLLATVAACGGGGGGNSASTPKCSTVWVDGKTLPKNYEGCMNGDTLEAGISSSCDRAGGDVFTYEPKGSGFFTDPKTRKITEAGEDYANDPAYPLGNGTC